MTKLSHSSLSDTGQIRANNEDAFGVIVPEDPDNLDTRPAVFVVADGMGGHRGGEIASRLAVEAVQAVYESQGEDDPARLLADAFADANARILAESVADTSLFGMGTTCTAMAVRGGEAYFSHVGDSRAYLHRDAGIQQITEDHSLVGEMVRSGIISDEDARAHPRRNIITRSLGIQDTVVVDAPHSPLALRAGDTFVLCSDGLTSHVGDDEIAKVVGEQPPADACQTLVDLANQRGGRDNITVQVIRVESL